MIRGLDVSAVQGKVDWDSVASMGCQFAFVKCSEGNRGKDPIFDLAPLVVAGDRASGVTGRDPRFFENIDGARRAGILTSPYHFAYALPHQDGNPLRDPAAQAKYAFDCSGGLGSIAGELPPMFDFEWPAPQDWTKWGCTAPQLRDWALQYLTAAEALWQCKPIVYTYPDFWLHVGGATEAAFAEYPLALASYPHPDQWPDDGEEPHALLPWAACTFWQFSGGQMKLPNGTPCDFDVFLGDQSALKALTE